MLPWFVLICPVFQYHTLNSILYRPALGILPKRWKKLRLRRSWNNVFFVSMCFLFPRGIMLFFRFRSFLRFSVFLQGNAAKSQVRCLLRSRQSSTAVRSPRKGMDFWLLANEWMDGMRLKWGLWLTFDGYFYIYCDDKQKLVVSKWFCWRVTSDPWGKKWFPI